MRLVTWNCCGAFEKIERIRSLNFDVAVIQECKRPISENPSLAWFGDTKKPNFKGVAIVATPSFQIRVFPHIPGLPVRAGMVEVSGLVSFLLLGIYAYKTNGYRYEDDVYEWVEAYENRIASNPSVIMGDFNSNPSLGLLKRRPIRSYRNHDRAGLSYESYDHKLLAEYLEDLGLTSSYHAFHKYEKPGEEQTKTYRPIGRETHIDYCFIPVSWTDKLANVEIRSFDFLGKPYKDHAPLIVDVAI